MQRIFHTPEGVRDIVGEECERKLALKERLHRVFVSYGCRDIETPTFEYFEVFSREVGTIPSRELYKFFDREGSTLVLRPDFTPSVSRACATYFTPGKEPVNLCYTGSTFINNSSFQGRLRESTQMGVERIGDGSATGDAEMLAMTVECLLAAGLTDFQISVGQVEYFKSLLENAGMEPEEEEELRSLISQKNAYGAADLVREKGLSVELQNALSELPSLFGDAGMLKRAKEMTTLSRARESIDRLLEIYELLKFYGYEKYIVFDLSMLSKYHYYTGIIFHAYTYGTGEPLIKGGRYDELMRHFGQSAPSIGFAIVVDALLGALPQEEKKEPAIVKLTYDRENQKEKIAEAMRLRREGQAVLLIPKEGL